jgi:hypothetical protein
VAVAEESISQSVVEGTIHLGTLVTAAAAGVVVALLESSITAVRRCLQTIDALLRLGLGQSSTLSLLTLALHSVLDPAVALVSTTTPATITDGAGISSRGILRNIAIVAAGGVSGEPGRRGGGKACNRGICGSGCGCRGGWCIKIVVILIDIQGSVMEAGFALAGTRSERFGR